MLGETLLSAVCVLGLGLAGWWLMGRLVRPAALFFAYVLIPCTGEGERMEQTLRGLAWLRSLGLLRCPVILADGGLSPAGREAALCLVRRWPDVILWPADDLERFVLYQ